MTEPYDLRSNIKGKPGSQGTLFQVKDKGLLNPQQRWPRGYTPERQAEVSGALQDIKVTHTDPGNDMKQRARVVDTVARSTMPASHVEGLSQIDASPAEGTSGTYHPLNARLSVDMLSRNEGDESGRTLVHELGHHDAALHARGTWKDVDAHVVQHGDQRAIKDWEDRKAIGEVNQTAKLMGRHTVARGVQEAVADNYMTKHYRPRGRDTHTDPEGRGQYEKTFTPEALNDRYPGYTDVRPPKPDHLGPQFDKETLF